MNTIIILLSALALGIHVFEITIRTGATQGNLGWKKIAGMGLLFGLIQVAMVIIGVLATGCIENVLHIHIISRAYRFVIFVIMIWFAVDEFWTRKKQFEERLEKPMSMKTWSLLAVRSGLESVALGMGIYFFDPTSFCGIICVICFGLLAPVFGLWYGYFEGFQGRKMLCSVNGIAMCVLAFAFMLI